MILSQIPTLGTINCGAELRVAAMKLQNYAQVNAKASGKFGELLASFWEDQAKLLKKDNGHPSDGIFLGFGVQDPRAQCYKALSAIRKSRAFAPQHGLAWEKFCDFLADAARKAGGVPAEVTLKLSKSKVNLAKADNENAKKAEADTGHKGNFSQTVTVTVTPAGTEVVIDATGMQGGTALMKGNIITVTPGTTDGSFTVTAGNKKVTVPVAVFDRGLTTKSIGDIEVAAAVALPKPFYELYSEGEHTATMYSQDPTIAEVVSDTVVGRKAGFTRIGAKIVYKDCPELAWADNSGVTVVDKPAAPKAKVARAAKPNVEAAE
ncbi:hypothetical protein Atoyac15_14 [Aeromonas phage Atoyac15]|uniref:Uncharacterized protein n=1 Tax=Aeromonas phage Atoyac15 TaxID=2767551 RepID=A0A866D1Q8_9CAUD|nr:hypothetical protein Atoyac15_14 [Aeromonas phage Atoyac15]